MTEEMQTEGKEGRKTTEWKHCKQRRWRGKSKDRKNNGPK